MMTTFWTFAAFAFAFGAIVGSFLNVVAHRLPSGESIVSPPSHCPACGTDIRWYDNVPIVSWWLLAGRCRHCDAPISWRYMGVEALSGGLALALWYRTAHPVFEQTSPLEPFPVAAVVLPFFLHFAFAALLIAIALVDLDHYIVPHVLTLPGMALGLAAPWVYRLVFGSNYMHVLADIWPPVTPWESIIGWLAGGLTVIAIFYLYFAARGVEGLGGGDVTLMATIGAWLGWPALIFVFFASSLQGTLAAGLAQLAGSSWVQPLEELLRHEPGEAREPEPPDPDEPSSERLEVAPGLALVRVPLEAPSERAASPLALDSPEADGRAGSSRDVELEPSAPLTPTDKLAIPYGPFLALAALEHLLLGEYMPPLFSMSYLYDLWYVS